MRHRRVKWAVSMLAGLCVPLAVVAMTLPTRPQRHAAPLLLKGPSWQSGAYWARYDHRLLVDFADLKRFRAADRRLGPPPPGIARVVFLGDSITEGWNLAQFFPGKPYVNRGISGQTTAQILLRFRQDVIGLHPQAVVILAGTNDLAGNAGPESLSEIEGNLASMVQLGRANGIAVVLCSVLPTVRYWWHPQVPDPAPRIAALNRWLQAYAARHHAVYVNYYQAMKDAAGGLRPGLSIDGVHPSAAGYAVMTRLIRVGIRAALKRQER